MSKKRHTHENLVIAEEWTIHVALKHLKSLLSFKAQNIFTFTLIFTASKPNVF